MKRLCAAVAGLWVAMAAVLAGEPGVLTQWSTIDALLQGHYQGEVSLAEVKRSGDFGLGTFEALDGEMLMLDGKVYQVAGSGVVSEQPDTVRTPFAAVTFFGKPDIELVLPAGLTLEQVQARVDAALPTKNVFYALRVTGKFAAVRTRSVGKQSEPYPLLAEVVKTQALFSFEAVAGELVGLRCPVFAKGINVPGYHFHFITADRKGGGHVLGLVTGDDVRVQIAVLREFVMKLPSSDTFDALDLSGDSSKVLHAVESERK
jgi:acetolactate decarboxylase